MSLNFSLGMGSKLLEPKAMRPIQKIKQTVLQLNPSYRGGPTNWMRIPRSDVCFPFLNTLYKYVCVYIYMFMHLSRRYSAPVDFDRSLAI